MGRHLERRTPRKNWGFSWGRLVTKSVNGQRDVLEYRLFLRERESGKLYYEWRHFDLVTFDRAGAARVLRGMRAQLKWVRDRMEFERLGMVDATPRPEFET